MSVEVSAANITVSQQPFTGHITQSRHIHSSQSHHSTVELTKPITGGRIKIDPAAFLFPLNSCIKHPHPSSKRISSNTHIPPNKLELSFRCRLRLVRQTSQSQSPNKPTQITSQSRHIHSSQSHHNTVELVETDTRRPEPNFRPSFCF